MIVKLLRKFVLKQKENSCKGDWIHLLREDFAFLEEDICDEIIQNTPKDIYKLWVRKKVKMAAFKNYLILKEDSKKKLKDLHYEKLEVQSYLQSSQISFAHKQVLYSLRSKCYPARMNLKRWIKGTLGADSIVIRRKHKFIFLKIVDLYKPGSVILWM